MNFFGHASVAYPRSDEPRFVLGAMLPDLTAMASVRLERVLHPELAAGVALHHETDRWFHASLPFRKLCESALEQLEHAGLRRGSARAVGHVGSELLLDGILSFDRQARAAYTRAIAGALREGVEREMEWRGDSGPERLRTLLERLAAGPLPERYRDVDFVCDRLQHLLAPRPRLALQPGDATAVRAWLRQAAKVVAREGEALLSDLRTRALRS